MRQARHASEFVAHESTQRFRRQSRTVFLIWPEARFLLAANNYANCLNELKRYQEAKKVLRKLMPVARRTLGEDNYLTLLMRWNYAEALYKDPAATLDDVREAVTSLEELAPIARRVMGGAHPTTTGIEDQLRDARTVLQYSETLSGKS